VADSCLQTDGRDSKSSAGIRAAPNRAARDRGAIGAQPKRLLEQTLGLDEQLAAADAG